MKKIMQILLICGSIFSASAQTTITTTTTTHKYYYYPSTNVYYDEATGNYWYWDNGSSVWSMTKTLPSTITVVESTRYPITYNGDDPWKNNAEDIKKYKVKDGKEKIKTSSTHKYYYYPSSNLYYDEITGNYWYWDNSSSSWNMTETLPSTIIVNEGTLRYPLTYTGEDPWKNNAADIKKYKTKDGKEKIKTSDTKIKTKDEK